MFHNPIERLRSEAGRLSEFPATLHKLQVQGSFSELASMIYSVYRWEHDTLLSKGNPPGHPHRLDYNLSNVEVHAFERLCMYKEHLKTIVSLIIEDVHQNFDSYRVTTPLAR